MYQEIESYHSFYESNKYENFSEIDYKKDNVYIYIFSWKKVIDNSIHLFNAISNHV